jgi:hypothetical protein
MGDGVAQLRELLCAHFAWAALLTSGNASPPLRPSAELLASLAWIPDDDPGFFDLLLSKRREP